MIKFPFCRNERNLHHSERLIIYKHGQLWETEFFKNVVLFS